MPNNTAGPSNVMLNKNIPPRYYPQQKVSTNGTPKYLNKPSVNNFVKANSASRNYPDKVPRFMYSGQKNPYKSGPVSSTYSKVCKNVSPQGKSIPAQIQRNSAGLRTIPPQRPPKVTNKTNYIGKHAVQAQKIRPTHVSSKMRNIKHSPQMNPYLNRIPQNSQVTFNQALTAQILETLGQDSNNKTFNSFNYSENKMSM